MLRELAAGAGPKTIKFCLESRSLVVQNNKILVILLNGVGCPVKAPRKDVVSIDNKEFVMQNSPLRAALNMNRDPGLAEREGDVMASGRLGFVVNQAHKNAALLGLDERLRNLVISQAINRAIQRSLGTVNPGNHHLIAMSQRTKTGVE